jgi:hypothetical protein
MALSLSDSINTAAVYLFSCNFSHLEKLHSDLVLVLHFPLISTAALISVCTLSCLGKDNGTKHYCTPDGNLFTDSNIIDDSRDKY